MGPTGVFEYAGVARERNALLVHSVDARDTVPRRSEHKLGELHLTFDCLVSLLSSFNSEGFVLVFPISGHYGN